MRAGPLGGLASLLVFLTSLPAGFLTSMIWKSFRKGGAFWVDATETTLLLIVLAWAPVWAVRMVLVGRRVVAGRPAPAGWLGIAELGMLMSASGLFGLGFVAAPDWLN
ncbi:hypothetical protein [Phenylobacterium sp. SCN 70-31]|uniref:hypothetical protein n=1 Tax=Phenylobacterium sp. SCN 70-31 TaxID=1660129 RepID=UPI00086DBDCA|nr:hypothetical protein [Phenylobacterium sp. SCN 70-31]ODT89135.1 MAG: hypothetical protein ABS78_02775 [Phenylobacterium sp. SCN 70-31]